ncbi:MAG: GGDEF domain-containing protein [Spirochaetales bacterium]|nr:GGDEF domain-containing protein [Spirochaetales bacterium]
MKDSDIISQRIHVLLRLFFILGASVHVILFGLFVYLRIFILCVFNIAGCCIFLFNFFLLKRKYYGLSIQLAIGDIVLYSITATYILGWECYAALYLIAAMVLIANSFTIKLPWKIAEVTLTAGFFIALFIITGDGGRISTVDRGILKAVGLLNIVTVMFTLLFMSFRNFIENETLQNRLKEMSEIDILTGAYNRRFFNKYLDIEIRRNMSQIRYKLRGEVNFGIAMLDLDNFKEINDRYGHLMGDQILIEFVAVIKDALFERDILCRYGGEEFVILFTSTSREGSITAIEKIRKLVEDHPFCIDTKTPVKHMTVSIGFACFEEESNIYRLLKLADKRLYEAKKAGKNLVISD